MAARLRPATTEEVARWDELIAANPDGGTWLQLREFGETKSRHGWQARYLMLEDGDRRAVAVLALSRNIPMVGELWYMPNGPGVTEAVGLERFADAVRELASRPFMVKIDPLIRQGTITTDQLKSFGYRSAPRNIQYNVHTAIVDLAPDEDSILADFRQKTRYNVRLAAKKGVTVAAVPTDQASIDTMYHLYATTTKRAGVYLRAKQYFADYWQRYADAGHGQMFFASYNGTVLAGAYVFYLGERALYKDGGSVREHTEVQAPYALQWQIMRWLKGRGVRSYDLHGTPPADHIDDTAHPLAGLARFKTGFQPHITEYIGTWDLPLDNRAYERWLGYGERLATSYEFRLRRRLFY